MPKERDDTLMRRTRRQLGLTQVEMAQLLGHCGQWVSNVECGRSALHKAERLALVALAGRGVRRLAKRRES